MFRYIKDPGQCLGADRLAKRVLQKMNELGIQTEVWKAHSLRGATATHLMAQGVPQTMVQARGNWSTQATLDKYYNRLHQQQDWAQLLTAKNIESGKNIRLETNPRGGDDEVRQTAACAAPPLTASSPKTTKEVEREEAEGGGASQAAV